MAKETQLIDVKPLMQSGWHLVRTGESNKFLASMSLADVPTVDAVEVVHGRWLKVQEPLGCHDVDCVECSACHESWIIDEDYCFEDFGGWNYCPNCGAKMDGGNDGD